MNNVKKHRKRFKWTSLAVKPIGYCICHLWSKKYAYWVSAVLYIVWIRSKISQCDQAGGSSEIKRFRLHLPMNIWCLSEARAAEPLSGHRGVGGNLPYLHLAIFQLFLLRSFCFFSVSACIVMLRIKGCFMCRTVKTSKDEQLLVWLELKTQL